jgi:hypothetical protein
MERNNNDIHLKDNELFYRIKCDEQLFKSIRHFGVKFLSDCNGSKLCITGNKKIRTANKETITFNESLDYGKNTLTYNGVNIYVNIIQFNKPICAAEVVDFHSIMEVQVLNNDNTLNDNKIQIKQFFAECLEHYDNIILNKLNEKGKTTIYIWDEYWETLEKGISRPISTVYLDGVEEKIKQTLLDFKSDETREMYEKFGISWKYNMLLHGLPGTGKTSLIYSLASELDMNIALLSFTRKMEDSDFMRALRRLPENTILIIEDIDTIFEARKKNDEMKNNITFSALLNTLDGIAHMHGQIIIMTTNHPLVLDKALIRPGRVDKSIEFGYSNKNQVKKMYEIFLPNQIDNFVEFYKKVKNLKLTTAILQQFFFGNIKETSIIDHIKVLEQLCNDNNYDTKNVLYS